ncbi:hypothetical protein GUITHDRAFT_62947 [Guillardia theta CCMP2712]|uniref:Mitochondrial carrier protein n=1 Tax=Guillardia theta (strain CCMP2712) TaxID=905079 RepID=L1K2X6_GUITC|nr:hypothetical protein GUITHDRAFT_62947 [Guillardia theta CCMP2712]EKX54780.1 hypothetical protein GUITHDRAFT_62947 [Guillardia theta CCMP2712]|eukprot:XP_005841760.1 hypothetical protein GUITHDRAFT_62947 [Guillardia theta CCMP2712]
MDPFVKDLFIGGLAGTISNIVVFPVDLAKTKMQNAKDQADKQKYGGFFSTVSSIVKEEGVHGLWSGSLPVLMGSAPESAIQLACHSWLIAFLLHGMSQDASSEAQLPLTLQIIAGGIAGASTLIATNPMEVLRIRAASSDQRCLITNVKSLGLLGLFAGYQATWLRDIPFAGIYFPMYCNMKVLVTQMMAACNLPAYESISMTMAGLLAGMFASCVTTPADVIKTRIQTNIGKSLASSSSTALSMVVEEGWHSFLSGVGPRVMRLAPGMAITLVIYETLQKVV